MKQTYTKVFWKSEKGADGGRGVKKHPGRGCALAVGLNEIQHLNHNREGTWEA